MFRDLYRTEIVIQSDSEIIQTPKNIIKNIFRIATYDEL